MAERMRHESRLNLSCMLQTAPICSQQMKILKYTLPEDQPFCPGQSGVKAASFIRHGQYIPYCGLIVTEKELPELLQTVPQMLHALRYAVDGGAYQGEKLLVIGSLHSTASYINDPRTTQKQPNVHLALKKNSLGGLV